MEDTILDGSFNIVVEKVYNEKFVGHFQYYTNFNLDNVKTSHDQTHKQKFEIIHHTSRLDSYLQYYTGDGVGLNKGAEILWKFNGNSADGSSKNYEPYLINAIGGGEIWRTRSMDLKFYKPEDVKYIREYFYLVYWISNQINQTPTKWRTIDRIYYQFMSPSDKHNDLERTFDISNPLDSAHYKDQTNFVLGIGEQKIFQFPAPKITAFEIISNDDFIKGNIKWGAIGVSGEKVKYNVVINNDDFATPPLYDLKQVVDVDINKYNDPSGENFNNFGKCEIEISNFPGYYKHNHEIKSLTTFKIGGSQATGIATQWSETYKTDVSDPSCVFWKEGKNITDFLVLDLSANEDGNVSWTHYSSYENWYNSSSKDSFDTSLNFHQNLLDQPIQYKLRIAYSEKSEERARLAALDSEDGNSICCTDWDVIEESIDPSTNKYVSVDNNYRAEFNYFTYKKHMPKQGYYYISIEMVSPLKTDKEEIIYVVGSDNVNYRCPYYRLNNVPSRELYRKTNQNTIITESLKRKYARVIRSKRTKCNF